MRSTSILWVAGVGLVLAGSGCRTHERIPDYLPRQVVANQVGSAVVYEMDDPRRTGEFSSPAATSAVSQAGTPTPAALPSSSAGTPVRGAKPPFRRTLYGQPEGVMVTENELREATISWTPPKDVVYRYRIERAESPSGPFVSLAEVAPDRKQYRDSGTQAAPLKDSQTYYYQIVAILDPEGPESIASKMVKTVTAPPPAAPVGVTATASGSRGIKLNWPPSPSVGVLVYRVERALAPSGTFERVGVVPTPPLIDGGTAASTLKDSTPYRYRVTAINRVNAESDPSVPVEVVTLPPPAPVQKVTVVSGEVRCVPVSWAPNPEPDVVRYAVYRSRSGAGPFEKIGSVEGRMSVTYLDGGSNPGRLEDETEYYYRIRAINAVTSEGADSETIRAVTCGVPGEVSAVKATSARPREVPITWATNADKAVLGYEIWRAEEGSDEWVQAGRVMGRLVTSFLDRGEVDPRPGLGSLKDGMVYQYKVIAFNHANVRSSASSAASARTKCRPATPAGLATTTNLPLSIRITWKPNPESDIGGYVVECSDQPQGSFRKLMTVSAVNDAEPAAKEMALESGVYRFYRVKAMDKDGLESDWCKPERGQAKPIPGMPLAVTTEPVGRNVRVTWKAPAQPDVRRYKVWRRKLIGWELVSTTDQTHYLFEFNELSKPMTIALSAVDQDELESVKSESLEIKPGL